MKTAAGVALLAIVMTGCSVAPGAGAPSASSTSPQPVVPSIAVSSPSVQPTRSGASSPVPASAPASPSLSHVDPELEGLLPAKLAGISLTRFSTQGSVFTAGGDMCLLICGDEPYRYAKELGVDVSDVTIGFAVTDRLSIGMIGYRARGAAPDRLIPARVAIGGYSGHAIPFGQPVSVAGRPATYLEHAFGQGEYLMTRHDVLFIVLGDAPARDGAVPTLVAEALSGVP